VARRSSLGCIRRFQLRARLGTTVAPFPAPPHQTVHEVFPHTAYLWEIRATQLTSFEPSPLASSENPKALPRFLALAMRYSWFSCEDTHSRGPSLTQGYVVLELKRCRVGGGAHRLTSVRRSNRTCGFPASGFHEDAPKGGRREGIKPTRFTKPISP